MRAKAAGLDVVGDARTRSRVIEKSVSRLNRLKREFISEIFGAVEEVEER